MVNDVFLFAQTINILFLLGWGVLAILALLGLRKRQLPPVALAIWVLIILIIPWLGAIAFWIIRPGDEQ